MTLKELRAVNDAKIATLRAKDPTSTELFRCEIVAQILRDDHCFSQMTTAEKVTVLTTIGLTVDAAKDLAQRL